MAKSEEQHRANTAIALLASARELLEAGDREGPRGEMRLFASLRPVLKQIEAFEVQLVRFIDSPDPTGDGHG